MNSNLSASGLGTFWLVLVSGFSVVTFIFWVIIAWRAMRAHERIAATLEQRLPR